MGELEQKDLVPYFARMLELPMQAAEEERVKYLTGEALQLRILEAVRDLVRSRALQQPLILGLGGFALVRSFFEAGSQNIAAADARSAAPHLVGGPDRRERLLILTRLKACGCGSRL